MAETLVDDKKNLSDGFVKDRPRGHRLSLSFEVLDKSAIIISDDREEKRWITRGLSHQVKELQTLICDLLIDHFLLSPRWSRGAPDVDQGGNDLQEVRVRGEALPDDLVDPGREGKGPLEVPENLIDQLLLLIHSLNHLLSLSLAFRLEVVVGIKPLKVGFFFEFEQNFGSLPVSVLSCDSLELFLEEVRGHVKLLGGESLLELLEVSSASAEDQCMNYASSCLVPHGPLYLLIAGTLN